MRGGLGIGLVFVAGRHVHSFAEVLCPAFHLFEGA